MRSNFVYITAWREDSGENENRRLMKSLRNDLVALDYKPIQCVSHWDGLSRPIYMMYGYSCHVHDFLNLSRKYGQNTLICLGDVYDVATGNVIGQVTREDFLKEVSPHHTRWIHISDNINCYIVFEFSISFELMNTLAAWSSGRVAPSPGA
jgi:hypothetical protein